MTRKPTLGFATRTDAVLALRRQSLSTKEIAERIGIEHKAVTALESSAGRSRSRTEECRTVLFAVELLDQCRPHAARRGITANELARRIVEAAIEDKMVDAVLDDAELIEAHQRGAA